MLKLFSYVSLLFWLALPLAALPLFDPLNYRYDINETTGGLNQGTREAYNHMYQLRINGASYTGKLESLSEDGQEVTMSAFIELGTGLEIKRRIHVDKSQNFARYMEIIHNPTENTQSVQLEIFGQLGSNSQPKVLEDRIQYLISQDGNSHNQIIAPTLLHYHSQQGNDYQAKYLLSGTSLKWNYPPITVESGKTARFIYFVAQTVDKKAATTLANVLHQNNSFLYENIPAEQRKELLNFTPLPASPTVDFTNAPFLSLGEVRNETLTLADAASLQRAATPAKLYAIRLEQDKKVRFKMSSSFNPYLYLYSDPTGQTLLGQNNDGHSQTRNAILDFTAPEAATYYLEATSYQRDFFGAFVLEVLDVLPNRSPDVYGFSLNALAFDAPATVNFKAYAKDSDGLISEYCWQFGDGSAVECKATAETQHNYAHAGHYTVGVTVKDSGGALAYTSREVAIKLPDMGVVLPMNSSISRELSTTDGHSNSRPLSLADKYLLNAVSAGKELVIDLSSSQFDSHLYLYDPYGQRLLQDDNSGGGQNARLRYIPRDNQPLMLEATSWVSNTLGDYQLTVRNENTDENLIAPVKILTNLNNPLVNIFTFALPDSFNQGFMQWDLGDGTAINTNNLTVAHSYARTGYYTISVTAKNSDGQIAQGSATYLINNQAGLINAKFRASPAVGDKPLRVFFNNESTTPLTGDHLQYQWDFGDGQTSADKNPSHTFNESGTFNVVLQVTSQSNHQSTAFANTVTVIDRGKDNIAVAGIKRQRPQIIMAGIDPAQVDLYDTHFRVFALVRAGASPLQSVLVQESTGETFMAMYHAATYADGLQRYEVVMTYPSGMFNVVDFSDLFGDGEQQFRIQVSDQNNQFYSFPTLEVGDNPPLNTPLTAPYAEPARQSGTRRSLPQVLAGGFDPAIIDVDDSQVEIVALVREGLYPIQTVQVRQQGGTLAWPMRLKNTLAGGDAIYSVMYDFPKGSLALGSYPRLFGSQQGQLQIEVLDQNLGRHVFPNLRIGHYPER